MTEGKKGLSPERLMGLLGLVVLGAIGAVRACDYALNAWTAAHDKEILEERAALRDRRIVGEMQVTEVTKPSAAATGDPEPTAANLKELLQRRLVKSCLDAAAKEKGTPAGVITPFCECYAKYLVDHNEPSELGRVFLATEPTERDKVVDAARSACSAIPAGGR
jgi:hypothetical protein